MIRRLGIDFNATSYRRAFRQILNKAKTAESFQIRLRGLVFYKWRQVHEPARHDSAAKRIHYVGLESDAEIQSVLDIEKPEEHSRIVFVATIRRDNLYRFSSETLDRATVIFVLGFVPNSIEERHQLFSLFHKSLMLRQVGPLLYYYSRVIDMLTTLGPLPVRPPDLVRSLGARALLYQFAVVRNRIRQKYNLWHRHSKRRASLNTRKSESRSLKKCRHVVITGWYGTETAGDKAILQELIHVLRETAPGTRISITSIVPGLSRLTNLELQLDAEILELRSINYRRFGSVDLVVFGGGPLMDSSQLRFIETLFGWARSSNVATMIFGCGVGPLKTDSGTDGVRSILRNTDLAFFRDEQSAVKAQELGFCGPKLHACDPAMRYVARWKADKPTTRLGDSNEQLVTLLRAQTSEYSESVEAESKLLREEVTAFLQAYSSERSGREVVMLPMHTFWLGNDDRDYNSEIVGLMPSGVHVSHCLEPQLLDVLLENIAKATWGLPMRYHGHIFMLALNIPFISVNYTGPEGKVGNLVERYGLGDFSLSVANGIKPGEMQHRWARMQRQADGIRARTHKQFQEDLVNLEAAYEQVFLETLGQDIE